MGFDFVDLTWFVEEIKSKNEKVMTRINSIDFDVFLCKKPSIQAYEIIRMNRQSNKNRTYVL